MQMTVDGVRGWGIVDLASRAALPSFDELQIRPYVGVWSPGGRADPRLRSSGAAGLSMVLAPADDFPVDRFDPAVAQRVVTVPCVDEALEALAEVARKNPMAMSVLHHVLVTSEAMMARDAFAVESFAYSMLMAGPEFGHWLGTRTVPVEGGDESAGHVAVDVSEDGRNLLVTLDRAQRKNAFGRVMRAELLDALTILDHTADLTAEIRGAGTVFCSGGDLSEFGTALDPVTAHLIRTEHHVGRVVDRHRDRIAVHAHGACIGAGVELPALAGRFTAAPGTWFCLPEVGMGLIPGAGGTVSMPRRIGRWRAAYMAMTGARIDTPTARDWGLIDSIGSY